MHEIPRRPRHQLLAEVAAHVGERLEGQHKLAPETAADIGNDIADYLAAHFGGQTVYFVKDEGYALDDRDREIFHAMGRGKASEIAKKYGLSYVRVYQIYRRVLKEYQRRAQPDLFGQLLPQS